MADLIKVKPKKIYEWNQDSKFVYVQIPLPAHSSLKKVDIYLSDLILRVTSLEKKSTSVLDLARQVDYKSPQNKFVLSDAVLHATLKKMEPQQEWMQLLIEDISLAELKIRRRESEARYEQKSKEVEQVKEQLRHDYDRKATQELMRFEAEERKKLDQRKEAQKQAALSEIFSGEKVEHEESKWREKERVALQLMAEEEDKESEQRREELKVKQTQKLVAEVRKQYENNTMFTDEQIDKMEHLSTEYEEIPIRQAAPQKVKFTEKVYPGLAARDTFIKEPPMPKGKHNKSSGGDLQNRNPLWLKDKGDMFFKDRNYISAIEAYSEALKFDGKQFKALMNRALCYIKTFRINEALADCDASLQLMQSQITASEQENAESAKSFSKINMRKAICQAWKGSFEQAKQTLKLITDENLQGQVEGVAHAIEKREESIREKLKGDESVKVNDFIQANVHYERSIEIDGNEYGISNKLLCLNRLKDYGGAVVLAERGIKRVTEFMPSGGHDKQASLILLKLYYRKAKAQEELGLIAEAEDTVKKGLLLDAEDEDLIAFLKSLKAIQNKQKLKSFKEEAAGKIKEGKHEQALQIYARCLKMLESSEQIGEYLSVLQNQCVCFLKLEQFDHIISVSIRILQMIKNIQSKIVAFGGKKPVSVSKEELEKVSVRTLMRRANAYIKTNQVYNAKADLQKALEICPADPVVTKELQKLKASLT